MAKAKRTKPAAAKPNPTEGTHTWLNRAILPATSTMLGGIAALAVGPSFATPVEITSDKTIYTIDVTECFADGYFCKGAKSFQTNTWYGNAQLARDLAAAATDKLGLPNLQRYPPNEGPYFIYKSGSPSAYNVTALPWDGYAWVGSPLDYINIYASGEWNSFTGVTTYNTRRVYLAVETSAPRPVPVAGPILPGNNGTSINTTASLASGGLLPQFQGGTLTVSSPNAIVADSFTLDGSSTNAIDINGLNSEFSGVFSDATGADGKISFINSKTSGYTLLSGNSTYSGYTYIKSGADVALGIDNALPTSTTLILSNGGTFNLNNYNQSLQSIGGDGVIKLGPGNLTLTEQDPRALRYSSAAIVGSGGLIKDGSYQQHLSGRSTYTGKTRIKNGTLSVDGSITSETTVDAGAILSGSGTIFGDVYNLGTVSPGNSIGTLTVDGSYYSNLFGNGSNLNIEVDGSSSDLLKITGDNRVALLTGNLNISSYNNAPVSPGLIYTAIDVTGSNPTGGEFNLKTNLNVIGSSGLQFVRETDPDFATISPAASNYYAICTSSDLDVQQGCTKLQFAWLKLNPVTTTPLNPATTSTPGTATIQAVKQTGGAITTASSGNVAANNNTCTSNSGNANNCQQINQPGTGSSGHSKNSVAVAKTLDAGWASVSAAAATGVTGGTAITSPQGTSTGYTTAQTSAALVTPDFVNVIGALFSIPTRQQLNQALHSISAEPYASMQSVALEALEQFRANTLALTRGRRLPFVIEEETCKHQDPTNQQLNTSQTPAHTAPCKPVTRKKLTPWSLLIDGSNTQASLNSTNDLASLDYNIFSSSYGLQYDFNRKWSAGAAFGYGRANLYNYEYSNTRINSNTYSGATWGIYRPTEAWKLTGLAGYMNLQYDSSRYINFGGLNRNAVANWSGNGFSSALAAEYDWILAADKASRSAVRIKPSTFFSYALHNQGAFSESGAQSLNLALESHTADSLIYGLGFTIETPIITGKTSRLIPKLYVGYEYDFNGDSNEEHQLTSSFAEVPALGSIDVLGQNRGANAVDIALAMEYETSETLSLYGNIGGAFWSNGNELNYGAGVRLRW